MRLQEARQRLGLERAVHPQRQAGATEGVARWSALDQRVHRAEHDARSIGRLAQPGEGGDPLGHQRRVGRDSVVRQAVPGREAQDLGFGGEEGQRLGEPCHPRIIARDVQHRTGELGPPPRQQQRVEPLRRAVERERGQATPPLVGEGRGEGELDRAASRIRRSIGLSASGGIGRRPISQSDSSTSGSSRIASRASSSAASSVPIRAATKPPTSRSFSWVPRWLARNSRRRRLASRVACSG